MTSPLYYLNAKLTYQTTIFIINLKSFFFLSFARCSRSQRRGAQDVLGFGLFLSSLLHVNCTCTCNSRSWPSITHCHHQKSPSRSIRKQQDLAGNHRTKLRLHNQHDKMPTPLTISPIPFRSSALAIPTSPFSPQLPLTPPSTPPRPITLASPPTSDKPLPIPPPANPLNWLWQCHLCHRTYKLGVTRRCLDDGHRFCSGVTVVHKAGTNGHRRGARVKRHKACASEFDYAGWKTWGDW